MNLSSNKSLTPSVSVLTPSVSALTPSVSMLTPSVSVLLLFTLCFGFTQISFAQESTDPSEPISSCESPNVLILLDRSGSMLEGDKWGQAQGAIEQVFSQFYERLHFGVLTFPWASACGVSAAAMPSGRSNQSERQEWSR